MQVWITLRDYWLELMLWYVINMVAIDNTMSNGCTTLLGQSFQDYTNGEECEQFLYVEVAVYGLCVYPGSYDHGSVGGVVQQLLWSTESRPLAI